MDNRLNLLDTLHTDREYFLARVQQELKRAQRYLSFISYLHIDTTNLNKTGAIEDAGPNNEMYLKLRRLIRKSLRQTDIISGFNKGKLCLLLVETQKEAAEIVKDRLHESIRYFLHEAFSSPMNWRVEIKIGSFPDGDSSPLSFLDSISADL